MNWDELYEHGISVENISRNSEEFETMFSAAIRKIPSAQYCLGLWSATVNNNPNAARLWLQKAAAQNFIKAVEAIRILENEGLLKNEESDLEQQHESNISHNSKDNTTSLVIKEHNFQAAKNSLKRYTEKAKKDVELKRVPTDGGLFNLGSHKVTGEELNDRMSQVQTYLINLNDLSQGLIDEFGEVYKAFESLDKDYISGIVASIKAAEEVSKQEQKDRKDIKELVAQHELSVAVLKKFKADIDQLKHLTDIDKAWDLIEKQARLSKEFSEYLAELSKVKHLKDVDELYTDFEKLQKEFYALSKMHAQYADELKAVQKYCDALSKLQHIGDIDELWNIAVAATQEIQSIKNTLEEQKCEISDFCVVIQQVQQAQIQFVEKIEQALSAHNEELNKQIEAFAEAQTTKLCEIDRNYIDSIEKLSTEQEAKLESIQAELRNSLNSAIREQESAISKIESTQKEKYEELLKSQSLTLEQIANEQSGKLEQIYQSLEAEKNALNEQVNVLTQKVKLLYIVAGSAAALTVIQLLLNILGVF